MKSDHMRIAITFLLVAIVLVTVVTTMYIGMTFPDSDPYYYTEHSGIIIGKNESRLAFYIETPNSVTMVYVGEFEFTQYEIGNRYDWTVQHRRMNITNMTMIHNW